MPAARTQTKDKATASKGPPGSAAQQKRTGSVPRRTTRNSANASQGPLPQRPATRSTTQSTPHINTSSVSAPSESGPTGGDQTTNMNTNADTSTSVDADVATSANATANENGSPSPSENAAGAVVAPQSAPVALTTEEMLAIKAMLSRPTGGGNPVVVRSTPGPAAQASTAPAAEHRFRRPKNWQELPQIEKPKGNPGRKSGWTVIETMLLDDDKETYNAFIYDVHKICHEVGIDCKAQMAAVKTAQMAKVFSRARHLHPYLGHFKNDWATAHFVRQYLSNCRKPTRKRRDKGPRGTTARSSRPTASRSPAPNGADPAGDDDEEDEEDSAMDLDELLDGEQEVAGSGDEL